MFHGGGSQGTFNVTSPDVSVSLSHGTWRWAGPRPYNATDVGFIFGEDGAAESRFQFSTWIVVCVDGTTAEFTVDFIFVNLDKNVMGSGSGTGSATRIEVVPID